MERLAVPLVPFVAVFIVQSRSCAAETFIVKDGEADAEIVIAEAPTRSALLAARDLQAYVEKITGAELAIVETPTAGTAVRVFVGRSAHTDKLGVEPYDIMDGGYRMVSGDKWLALLGGDKDFVPIEPWPRSHGHWMSGKVHAQWDQITGAKWGNPLGGFHKRYSGRTWTFKPGMLTDDKGVVQFWNHDEMGTMNAVCDFLRGLGVRWYMPGELGEVVPRRASIALAKVNKTVRPDFPVRRFCFQYGLNDREMGMWAIRLGLRDPYDLLVAHGIATMVERKEFLEANPEYFALYGSKRNSDPKSRYHQPCLSSEGLFRENVAFVRALFDHYQFRVASVMPPDAFGAICQCDKCKGKDTPERGYRGRLSDYVWDYVNRVAKEVEKTHPDEVILCCAYGTYKHPPLKIEKLNRNVIVCIVGGREPTNSRAEVRAEVRKLREAWLKKTDNKIMVFENYPFTARGMYLPAFTPHVLGDSVNATKGISQGEDIWMTLLHHFDEPGFNHFLIYFTARMYWGGKRDVDALFREYCELFYGPAGDEMRAFFEYCEANWQDLSKDEDKTVRALALFDAAAEKADAGSVYGKRLAVMGDYLKALRSRSKQLQKGRGPVPEQGVYREARGIKIDGKLDDDCWKRLHYYANGSLRELQTGRRPFCQTRYKVAWDRGGIYFAIHCEDLPGQPLNVATTRNDDPAIWYGDVVEVLLETDQHSYYQIAVNPSGAICDLDRESKRQHWLWGAQAEVATHVGDGYWNVEIKVPVIQDRTDPLHQVIGRKPTSTLPWFFNVCRQRLRGNGTELSAFSPTGEKHFHVPMKFGKLYVK